MSGIETRSRLEQLHALRNRIDQEINTELRRNPPPRRPPKQSDTTVLLAELGVTAKHVKEWACTQGLIPAVARGRVALHLVEAYAAHMDTRDQLDQHDDQPTRQENHDDRLHPQHHDPRRARDHHPRPVRRAD